jgi:prepilin-type N-terminal cleavage/methylation domain-containing protein
MKFSKAISGFTLIELLVSAAIGSVVITVAGAGMVNILSLDNNVELKTDRRIELDRTLYYIASDVRESKSVSTTTPTGWTVPSGYTGIVYLTKPDNTHVAYYTKSSTGTNWRGSNLIYRATASNNAGGFILDAITSTTATCTGSGTASGSEGFRAIVAANNLSANICLQTLMPTSSSGETMAVSSLAAVRSY